MRRWLIPGLPRFATGQAATGTTVARMTVARTTVARTTVARTTVARTTVARTTVARVAASPRRVTRRSRAIRAPRAINLPQSRARARHARHAGTTIVAATAPAPRGHRRRPLRREASSG